MYKFLQTAALALGAAVLSACGGGSGSGAPAPAPAEVAQNACASVMPITQNVARSAVALPLSAGKRNPQASAQRVELGVPPGDLVTRAQIGLPGPGLRQVTGFARPLSKTASASATAGLMQWQGTPGGGSVAVISFVSAGAVGIRTGVVVYRMPKDAVIRLYATGNVLVFETSGAAVLESVQRNVDAGGNSDAARTYWTPAVDGEESILEIELAQGSLPNDLVIAIPRLSHLYQSALAVPKAEFARAGTSGSCQVDVSCATAYASESNATAKMNFVAQDGRSYVCTGTLLADRPGSGTPYFLTANHCISQQSEASSVVTYWFYRSSSCNSGTLSTSARTLAGGATLLYANATTDTSFMRLNGVPPSGVTYAGWDPAAPVLGESIAGIHHPGGDLQKINNGSFRSFLACTTIDAVANRYSCEDASEAGGNYLSALWSRGVTESGSSGSGLFKSAGGVNYLVGHLRGGSSSCSNPTGNDSYGRFDVAYKAALRNWLDTPACNAR